MDIAMETLGPGRRIAPWWQDNPVLIHLAGLSPVLAVSSLAVSALALGLATLLVCALACAAAPLLRHHIAEDWRVTASMVTIGFLATLVMILMQTGFYPLYLQLGIYVPLICCNAAILLRMETRSGLLSPPRALLDGIGTGVGFLVVILAFGMIREWLSFGTVFYNASLLLPLSGSAADAGAAGLNSAMFPQFRFTLLQPGAFILLGLLVAARNALEQRP